MPGSLIKSNCQIDTENNPIFRNLGPVKFEKTFFVFTYNYKPVTETKTKLLTMFPVQIIENRKQIENNVIVL